MMMLEHCGGVSNEGKERARWMCPCEDSNDDILQRETEKEAEQEEEKSYSIILTALCYNALQSVMPSTRVG